MSGGRRQWIARQLVGAVASARLELDRDDHAIGVLGHNAEALLQEVASTSSVDSRRPFTCSARRMTA